MQFVDFEFKSKELRDFRENIREGSSNLINKIIKENSPIQIGEDVKTTDWNETQILRVISIKLWAISSFGFPGNELSFSYEGIPLKKNGEPMKNRKPVPFWTFIKNGKEYHMPSYFRIKIKVAVMY